MTTHLKCIECSNVIKSNIKNWNENVTSKLDIKLKCVSCNNFMCENCVNKNIKRSENSDFYKN